MTVGFFLWPVIKLLVWVVFGVTVYALILRRLAQAAQATRLRLAEEGEQLLTEGYLPEGAEQQVRFYLDNAFSGTTALFWSIAVPIAIVQIACGWKPDSYNSELEIKLSHLGDLFGLSLFAANPIFGTIIIFELIVLGTAMAVITGSFRTISVAIDLITRSRSRGDRGNLLAPQ